MSPLPVEWGMVSTPGYKKEESACGRPIFYAAGLHERNHEKLEVREISTFT